ncbi:CHASE3 domain-containing protein [Niveibacterium sp. SC-1]|uniref:CHASE3 domain-containing protein n=1 Tax=Niveibacterium sp. SC-1 TaxID=3135646 RepID=UPI00311DDB6D
MASRMGGLLARAGASLKQAWPHIILAFGCAIVLTLLVVSFQQRQLALTAVDVARSNAQLLRRLDAIQLLMADCESSVRGYVITRDPAVLDVYYRAKGELPDAVNAIRRDYPIDEGRRSEMNDLLDMLSAKQAVLATAVETLQRGENYVADRRGREYMDRIRVLLGDMRDKVRHDGEGLLAQFLDRYRDSWLVTLGLSCLAMLLLVMLFSSSQRRTVLQQRLHNILRTEADRLEATVAARTVELSELASHLNVIRESEKESLARELHDELGAVLTAAKMEVATIQRRSGASMDEAMRERFARLIELLNTGIGIKRRIIDDLRPPLLIELGLTAALRAMAEDFAHAQGVKLRLELPEDEPVLNEETSLAFFRIAQESLTNIRKYAHATEVELWLRRGPDGGLELSVADNGRGFDAGVLPTRSHGITGMRHRMRMLNGALRIDTRPGSGARVVALVPPAGLGEANASSVVGARISPPQSILH